MRFCPRAYYAVLGPGEEFPELFFANQAWARDALAMSLAESPHLAGLLRIVCVRVGFDFIEEADAAWADRQRLLALLPPGEGEDVS